MSFAVLALFFMPRAAAAAPPLAAVPLPVPSRIRVERSAPRADFFNGLPPDEI